MPLPPPASLCSPPPLSSAYPIEAMFIMCALFLGVCVYLQRLLANMTAGDNPSKPSAQVLGGH